ncbi:MAG TPA: DUF2059 domain-containing protein [Candidatus Saccharimonadales bacterium]|nr:DUF2059 domain-containing protein [Candidatus Saccharimonadales bacterium]
MKTFAIAAVCAMAPLAVSAAPRAPKLALSALQQTAAPQPQANGNPSSPDTPAAPVKTDPAVEASNYSKDEIDRLSVFYATPLGKKSLSVTQKATFEIQMISMKQGEQWGRESMMEVLAEHPDLATALEAASAGPKN